MFVYLQNIMVNYVQNRKLNQNITKMKANKNLNESAKIYEAPTLEIVEVAIERGFEASDAGFEGPSYGEEDVDW